jgi:hypothetical protein
MGGAFTEDEANKKRLRKENGVSVINSRSSLNKLKYLFFNLNQYEFIFKTAKKMNTKVYCEASLNT